MAGARGVPARTRCAGAYSSLTLLRLPVVALLTACHVWSPAELGPGHDFVNGRTRLLRADGSSVIMRGPRIVGDSIVGTWPNTSARMAVPRAEVQRAEVYRVARGRTALAGVGLAALYIAAVALFSDSPRGSTSY